MKKNTFFLSFLVVIFLFLTFLSGWGVPGSLKNTYTVEGNDGTIYIADNSLFFSSIYGVDSSGTVISFYREFNGFGNSSIHAVGWDGQSVYFLRETLQGQNTLWEPVKIHANGGTESLGGAIVSGYRATSMSAPSYVSVLDDTGGISAGVIDISDGTVLLLKEDFCKYLPLYASYSTSDDSLAVLDAGGTWSYITSDETYTSTQGELPVELPRKISFPLNIRLACNAPFLIAAAILSLIVGGLFILLFHFIRSSRRLVMRLTIASGLSLFVALCVIGGILFYQSYTLRFQDRLDDTQQIARQVATSVSSTVSSDLLSDDFYGSSNYLVCSRLLSGTDTELLSLHNDELQVAVSSSYSVGVSATDAYGEEIAALLEQAVQQKNASSLIDYGWDPHIIAASPVLSNGVVTGVVLVDHAVSDILLESFRLIVTLLITALFLLAILCVLMWILLRRIIAPIGKLTQQMEEISDGHLKIERFTPTRDELGQMAKAMQEMCMGLSIRNYEIKSTLQSYGRFIPRGLPELLNRASIMEVSFGDVQSITGNVAVLAVVNRNIARTALEDAPFVNYVNQCFDVVSRSIAESKGHILSSGFEHGILQLYFPGTAQSAVSSALHMLGEIQENKSSHISPKFVLILHHTTFLYGVAGSDEQAFPFLSSQEMEFLSSYSSKLSAAGSKIVFTHQIKEILPDTYQKRYIGYVTDSSTQESYKLYELLDAYPELERNLRIWYDKEFQEAIQLFYRSDFYLARTIFSNLLRSCPSDGIIRWYLFACEYYFQSGDKANFQLFSIDP